MECHECGATISDRAADCPHCGASVRDLSGGGEADDHRDDARAGDAGDGTDTGTESLDETRTERNEPSVPGTDSTGTTASDDPVESTDPETVETTEADADDEPAAVGTDEGATAGETGEESAGSATDAGTETGWEAAGPPPDEQDAGGGGEAGIEGEETTIGGHETADEEPAIAGGSDFGGQGTDVDDSGFGGETDTGGGGPEIPDRTGETGTAGGDTGAGSDAARASSETTDLAEGVGDLPFLSGPIAGLVTAAVLAVLSVVVAALDPDPAFDTVPQGALVLLDLHFATGFSVEPDFLVAFGIADPRVTPVELLTSSVGILYLLPVIFCYTAAKFVAAYNVDETTPLPLAGAAGALIAVGYFPVMLVALALAPNSGSADVSFLRAVLLGGLAYPLVFGSLGGLAAGAFSASERRVGTLYGVVAFFLMTIGAFAVTLPALTVDDVGLLPQVHASLFTIVSANGFGLPNPETSGLVSLGYLLVAGVVFAAGFVRAWNASDVKEPLKGAAKGLSPVATYFVLLGVVATVLPLLADGDVAAGLGLDSAGVALVRDLVRWDLATIDQYIFVVFVGTLVYAVFLGGLGGAVAGGARYALSEEN
jgi:hypothetical protein